MVDITAQSLKMRFPEFAEVEDALVQFAIEEAAMQVDDSWISTDVPYAISYFAAHLLALAQASADVGGRAIVSESIGRISVTYAQSSSSERTSSLQTTIYGQRFKDLQRRNGSSILVLN